MQETTTISRTNETARLEVRRACGNTLSSSNEHGLPSDLLDKAVTRLGWVALFYAVALQAVHWGRQLSVPERLIYSDGRVLLYAGLFGGTILALVIASLAWSRKLCSSFMLDLGLVFEVAGAFSIGLVEYSINLPIGERVYGWSGIVLWIAVFVLVIPATLGRTAIASIASILMGPIALLLYGAIYQRSAPDLPSMAAVFVPHFLFALLAIILSRFVYSLGTDLNKARAVGRYELVELLGRGGMGEVWKAKHRMLARPAALKLISPAAIEPGRPELTTSVLRRFEREAQATAALRSPNTVHVYDFGTTSNGSLYYAMELLDGLDLDSMVEKYGPVPAERAIHFMLGITSSLEEAHSLGVIHRDIKPANIYACRQGADHDFVKVLDFGLASLGSGENTRMTVNEMTSGTPAYMAPEVAMGSPDVDNRADIYALGCVGYWLLTGRLVFEADSAIGMIFNHVNTQPVPPSERTELEIPSQLERLIMDCLEKDPNRRPSNVRAIARRLEAIGGLEPWSRDRADRWWQTHRPDLAANLFEEIRTMPRVNSYA
jgi:eukaryotic-like serine/threonine-protein kinase